MISPLVLPISLFIMASELYDFSQESNCLGGNPSNAMYRHIVYEDGGISHRSTGRNMRRAIHRRDVRAAARLTPASPRCSKRGFGS